MIQTYLKRMPELAISGAMILIMLLFSLIFNLPIIYPSGERAAFVGIHYIYPLIGVGLLGILTFFVGNRAIASRFLIALPCYAAIPFAHFNIKLWIPHINPTNFDASYWALDQLMRRSEEHTSELQSLMRTSYAVSCLKQNTQPPKLRPISSDTSTILPVSKPQLQQRIKNSTH